MGEFRGTVTRRGGESKPYVSYKPGGQLVGSYESARLAMAALERTWTAGRLRWTRADLAHIESYRAEDPTFWPADLKPVLWARSDTVITVPGSTDVEIWGDRSENGNRLTPAVPASAPSVEPGGIYPEIRFEHATSDRLDSPLTLAVPFSVSIVAKASLPSGLVSRLWHTSGPGSLAVLGEVAGRWIYDHPGRITGPATTGGIEALTVIQGTARATLVVNGLVVGTSAGVPASNNSFHVSALSVPGVFSAWNGAVYEIVVVPRDIQVADAVSLNAYYNRRYRIA